jgi:hypothetical protein
MVVKVNEKSAAAEPMNVGVARQRLLTPERVDNVDVLLDRLTLAAGASTRFEPSTKSLAWRWRVAALRRNPRCRTPR